MPLEIRDRDGQHIKGASVNLIGGTCLLYFAFMLLAIIGFLYLIGTIIDAIF